MKLIDNLLVLLALLVGVETEIKSQTFELPQLNVQYDQLYLHRKSPTVLTCRISPGWSEARMVHIDWLKDGELITRVSEMKGEFELKDGVLNITGAKQPVEGNYQCLATLHKIRLSNRQYVETSLVSPPIKLRRARMTKFDRTTEHFVDAQLGEVARLPCIGMPDVIPGPPEVCFERDGDKDRCFGDKTDKDLTKYLSTPSGLQIALVQPEDEGKYYCVVRNTYTNSSRKSPKGVFFKINKERRHEELNDKAVPDIKPQLLFPTKGINKPIIVDVVMGQDIILECVFSKDTKVVWKRDSEELRGIIHNDEIRPLRQIWGNLRIKNVSQQDAGIYSCHGLNPFEDIPSIEDKDQPRAHYKLVVHAPTSVKLAIQPRRGDGRFIQLSCLAEHLHYEIPMVYVNATPLINNIDQMGIPDETNFYTNPVNLTMEVHRNFSGSIQCLSRPAMDEAEIYGMGLERGMSDNIFVVNSGPAGAHSDLITQGPTNTTVMAGERADLICVVQKAGSKYWKFKCASCQAAQLVKIIGTKMKTTGSNTLRIENVQPEDEGWYTCIIRESHSYKESSAMAYLRVLTPTTTPLPLTTELPYYKPEMREIIIDDLQSFVNKQDVRVMWNLQATHESKSKIKEIKVDVHRIGGSWIEGTSVETHVPATTLKGLIPNTTYTFRVRAVRKDGSEALSAESNEFTIELPFGDIKPDAPQILSLEPVSSTSLLLKWTTSATIQNAEPKNTFVFYKTKGEEQAIVNRIPAGANEFYLEGLKPITEYTVFIVSENEAGRSPQSKSISAKTFDVSMENGLFDTLFKGLRQIAPGVELSTILIILGSSLLLLIILLVCCVIFCNLRSKAEKQTKGANGKFLDTSYRIFNEQKVHKSKLPTDFFNTDDVDECSPLRMQNGNGDGQGFILPNVYGEVEERLPELEEDPLPPPPHDHLEHNYMNTGLITMNTLNFNGVYGGTVSSARCYSPESGTSHEMLLSNGAALPFPPQIQNPLLPSIISSPQRIMAYRSPDSLLYSPAGTASNSLAGSSEPQTRTTCDSPPHPGTDGSGSDPGLRCGGSSSRNSQKAAPNRRMKADDMNCYFILFSLIVFIIALLVGITVWCHGKVCRPHGNRKRHEERVAFGGR
ncbi:unnamed protein product, partial [Mesorhabditis belari]|uniref:Uncharacterized protein n=1 Tax=Mesorhabditis belari TaxID=2138241 RepID=A0AAF3EUD9_9BILA